ncbi:MAG: peptidoglycan-binding protein [Pseudomonadota bacterium]
MNGLGLTIIRHLQVLLQSIPVIVIFAFAADAASLSSTQLLGFEGAKKVNENSGYIRKIAVFGQDNRATLPRKLRSLRKSIGLVYNNRARSVCTGFCVADQTIATAAHCLFRTAGERRPKLSEFRFVLRAMPRWPSSRIAGYPTRSPEQFVIAGSRKLKVEPPIDATKDWALMRLSRPLCRGATLPVSPRSTSDLEEAADRKALLQVSFHHDYANWRLAHAAPCSLEPVNKYNKNKRIDRDFTAPEDLILHRCDTGGASSGSPLLLEGKDGSLSVVAINVGTYVQTRMLVEKGKVVRRFKSDAIANTAVSARVFADLITPFTAADLLINAPDIRQLQTLLSNRGLYSEKVDGSYGPATREAIQAFQGNIGDELAGLPTRRLLKELQSLGAKKSPANAKTRRQGSQHLSRGRLKEKIKPAQ